MNWYIKADDGTVAGPFSDSQLIEGVRSGMYGALTSVSCDGAAWSRLGVTRLWREAATPVPQQFRQPPAAAPAPVSQVPQQTDSPRVANPSDFPDAAGGIPRLPAQPHAGLGESFSLKSLFSEVFRRHSHAEIEDYFSVGFPSTTPELTKLDVSCPRPWVFVRTLFLSLALYMGFLFAMRFFGNVNLIPGLITVGAFAVPLSVVIFFFEVNIRRNVSLCTVIFLVMLGGLLSLIFTLIIYATDFGNMLGRHFGASAAGVVEEVGKILAVVTIARFRRYPYRLNGLLFGAAIGAGFAAFESAGYVLNATLESGFSSFVTALAGGAAAGNLASAGAAGSVARSMPGAALAANEILCRGMENGAELNGLRAALAPFGHVVWTAIAGAAFWRVHEDGKTWLHTFTRRRFLALFLVPVVLHAFWNSDFRLPFMLKYILIGLVGWGVALALVRQGIIEVREKKTAALAAGGSRGIIELLRDMSPLNFLKTLLISVVGTFCASLAAQLAAFVFHNYLEPLLTK